MSLGTVETTPDTSDEFSMDGIIDHVIAFDETLPPLKATKYEYVMAASGLLIRARRKGLEVCLPIAEPTWPVMGLADITPHFNLEYPLVPAEHVTRMLERSRAVCKSRRTEDLLENLFYLLWNEAAGEWELIEPEQEREHASVRPVEDGADSPYGRAFIEIHSHHTWEAEASETDDTEEIGKFRIFVVLGSIFDRPSLRVRVCVHEYFIDVPASCIFEMPEGVKDCLTEELEGHDKAGC
jgi:PRTRC genetic system protein A